MESLKQFRILVREILLEALDDAQILSQYAHRGQTRRTGEPYFFHPQEVANIVKKFYPANLTAYYTALLHDAIEDGIPLGNITDEEELYAFLVDAVNDDQSVQEIFDSIRTLTKSQDSDYNTYIGKIVADPTALKVKVADMMHNLNDAPSERQKKKYTAAFEMLKNMSGGVPAGISSLHWQALEDIVKNAK